MAYKVYQKTTKAARKKVGLPLFSYRYLGPISEGLKVSAQVRGHEDF